MINIFVIDDHQIVIDGIRSNFADGKDKIKISGTANSAKEALPKLKRSKAKVVLLDLLMPEYSGIEFCSVIKNLFPDKKVIALTGETNPTLLYNVWSNQVDAIILKSCGKEELVETINSVLEGNRSVGSGVPDFAFDYSPEDAKERNLTKGETRVLNLLAKNNSRDDVAEMIGISRNAVNFHCRNLFRKFNKNKMLAVIEEAKKEKLIV